MDMQQERHEIRDAEGEVPVLQVIIGDDVKTEGTMVIAAIDKGDHIQSILRGGASENDLVNMLLSILKSASRDFPRAVRGAIMEYMKFDIEQKIGKASAMSPFIAHD